MPYVPVPKGSTNISISGADDVPWVEYKGTRVYETGLERTGVYPHFGGTAIRSKGPMVIRGGKRWSPCRSYERSAYKAWWTGTSTTVYNGTAAARKGNIRVWQGIAAPVSIWSPTQRLPFGVSTTSALVSGQGVGTINALGRNRAATQLLKKAGQRKVNYGEALGESRQTLSMIARTSITVIRAFLAVRKGRFGEAARLLGVRRVPNSRSAAEAWLSYQYGWAPLLSDIYDSSKLLKSGLTSGPQLFSVSSFWDESAELADKDPNFDNAVVTSSVKVGGKLWYRISDQSLSNLNQLGLINPLEVAWALVPWSFVIDWFIPVGSMLEAWSARMGLTFHDGYFGCRVSSKVRKSGCKKTHTSYSLVSSDVEACVDVESYKREPMSSLPWPGLYYKSPFSSTHVVNALALLRTLKR